MVMHILLPDTVRAVLNVRGFQHHLGSDSMHRPVGIPYAHVADDERVVNVRSNTAATSFAMDIEARKIEGKIALTVRLVIFELNKRQGADIHLTQRTVQSRHRKNGVESLGFLHVEP